jgi:hypothetical protein
MKKILQKLFSPILNLFESGVDVFVYKPSHRIILNVVGCLFLLLASGIFFVGFFMSASFGFLLPGLIFSCVALVSLVVGCLGSDKAVAKIWGSR